MENEKITLTEDSKKAAVLLDLVFSGEAVSTHDILARHGVDLGEFAKWLGDDGYVSEVRDLSSRAGEAEMARVIRSLSAVARDGDVKAAKTLRELIGEPGEGSVASGGAEAVIEKFRELDRAFLGVDE